MSIKSKLGIGVFMVSPCLFAQLPNTGIQQAIKNYALPPGGMVSGGYNNYQFDSTNGSRFKRYNGHNGVVTVGTMNFALRDTTYVGIMLNGGTSHVEGRSRLQNNTNGFEQNSKSIGLATNILQQLSTRYPVFLNFFAGVNQNHYHLENTLAIGTANATTGRANYYGHDVSLGTSAMLPYRKGRWLILGGVGYLYNRSSQDGYTTHFGTKNASVDAITMSQHNLSESVRFSYASGKQFIPFANVALLQGFNRKLSKDLSSNNSVPAANLPSLLVEKSGYRLGTGVTYKTKSLQLIPMYNYLHRGKTFHSHTFNVLLKFPLS